MFSTRNGFIRRDPRVQVGGACRVRSFNTLTEAEAQMWTPPNNPGVCGHKGRYLWTDAFGVMHFITVAKETVSPVYLVLAKRLSELEN